MSKSNLSATALHTGENGERIGIPRFSEGRVAAIDHSLIVSPVLVTVRRTQFSLTGIAEAVIHRQMAPVPDGFQQSSQRR